MTRPPLLSSSLDELQELIQNQENSSLDDEDHPHNHDFLTVALRDLHFHHASTRGILHRRMIGILDRMESATTQEKDSFFRYSHWVALEQGRLHRSSFAASVGGVVDSYHTQCPPSSFNPLVNWSAGVTDRMLSFLDPIETICLLPLSSTFYANFWGRCTTLMYTTLRMGFPWNHSPALLRRRLFPRFSDIQTLMIESVAASVLDGENLEDLIRRSTLTLQRLHIDCSPTESMVSSTDPMPSQRCRRKRHASLTPLKRFDSTSGSSDQDKRFRCVSVDDRENRTIVFTSRVFKRLENLELIGGDSLRWLMLTLHWTLPHLKGLTLQIWTEELTLEEDLTLEEGLGESIGPTLDEPMFGSPREEGGFCRRQENPRDVFMMENSHTVNDRKTLKVRSAGEATTRRHLFNALLRKVASTVWDLKFLVPGWQSEDDCALLCERCATSTTAARDPIARSSWDDSVLDKPRSVATRTSNARQFEDFSKLLQGILFNRSWTFLRKIEFLGLPKLNFALAAFSAALSAEYDSRALLPDELVPINTNDHNQEHGYSERSTAPLLSCPLRCHYMNPPFENEPQQPCLPLLDFQDDWDVQQGGKTKSMCERETVTMATPACRAMATPACRATDWPDVSQPPIGRALLVFTGLLQWPLGTCIEFSCLYPLCIKSLRRPQLLSGLRIPLPEAGRGSVLETPTHRGSSDMAPAFVSVSEQQRQVLVKVRVQPSAGDKQTELDRRRCVDTGNQYLQPAPRQSQKGKPPSRKKPILAFQESQDGSSLISAFSDSVTDIAIFLGEDPTDKLHPFTVMRLPRLKGLRLVNWNGGNNRSHLNVFNLVSVIPPQSMHLTVETNEPQYSAIRRKDPKAFYASLIRFVLFMKARGMMVDRISLFPGAEQEHGACYMNYFFPVKRLHVASPPLAFMHQFQQYQIPPCLFTLFLSGAGSAPLLRSERESECRSTRETAGDMEHEEGELPSSTSLSTFLPPRPPQLTLNSQLVDVAEPLERRYSTIREFLVEEVEKQTQMLSISEHLRPWPALMTVAWKDATEDEINGKLPLGVNSRVLLNRLVETYSKQTFFSDDLDPRDVHLTLSCHLGLAELYRMIIGIRTLAPAVFTERPFRDARMLVQFDSQRYASLSSDEMERGAWLMETVLLPWVTLIEIFAPMGLGYCFSVLLDPPFHQHGTVMTRLCHTLESHGPGLTVHWIGSGHRGKKDLPQDLAIVVLHPREWNPFLCRWTLDLVGRDIGDASSVLLKRRAEMR